MKVGHLHGGLEGWWWWWWWWQHSSDGSHLSWLLRFRVVPIQGECPHLEVKVQLLFRLPTLYGTHQQAQVATALTEPEIKEEILAQSQCAPLLYGTVSAKIAPRLKCYKNASRLNRYNFPMDNASDFLFSTLHTRPFSYEVLNIGSR